MRPESQYRYDPVPHCEQKILTPWRYDEGFLKCAAVGRPYTLVTDDRLWVLYCLARQTATLPGNVIEAGVYQGGSLMMLGAMGYVPHGFDAFVGLDAPDRKHDRKKQGDFDDVVYEAVRHRVAPYAYLWRGHIPEILKRSAATRAVRFAHVDLDLHQSVLGCCEALYPALVPGGVLVCDDYGGYDTPGAADAIDEFFAKLPEVPLILPTGQAVVTKLP